GGSVVVSWRGRVGSRGGNPPVCPLRATGARAGAERGSWGPASGGVGGPRGRSPPDLVRDERTDDASPSRHHRAVSLIARRPRGRCAPPRAAPEACRGRQDGAEIRSRPALA